MYSIWPSSSTSDEVRQSAGVSVGAWYMSARARRSPVSGRFRDSRPKERAQVTEIVIDKGGLLELDDFHSDDQAARFHPTQRKPKADSS